MKEGCPNKEGIEKIKQGFNKLMNTIDNSEKKENEIERKMWKKEEAHDSRT